MKKFVFLLILSIVAISLISTVIAADINDDGISDGVVVKKNATPLKIKFIPLEQLWTKSIKVGDLLRDNKGVTYKVLQKTHDNQSRLCYQLKDLTHSKIFWVISPSFTHYDKINGTAPAKNSTHNDTNKTPDQPHKDIKKDVKKNIKVDKKTSTKMKTTGIPIIILVLAVLAIIFGYTKRRK